MVLFVNGNFSIFFNVLKIENVRALVGQKRPYNPTSAYVKSSVRQTKLIYFLIE